MIQLIVGHKGSGKTKAIVEMANKAVRRARVMLSSSKRMSA